MDTFRSKRISGWWSFGFLNCVVDVFSDIYGENTASIFMVTGSGSGRRWSGLVEKNGVCWLYENVAGNLANQNYGRAHTLSFSSSNSSDWPDFLPHSHITDTFPSSKPLLCTHPGAHPASYTMDTRSFQGLKQPGHGIDHPPPSSAKVKERVELYLYSPSGPSWPVLGWTFYLFLYLYQIQSPWRQRQ
jgi:hypothetical protein